MTKDIAKVDIFLIGAGIMSSTLAIMLRELNPKFNIKIVETLNTPAGESSSVWNNAGTGHSGFCELNYTPLSKDGAINMKHALDTTEEFEISRQFWSYLINSNILSPNNFIHNVPHMSFVSGDENIHFLKKRFEVMKAHHFYEEMEYTDNPEKIKEWVPLMMSGRNANEKIAATKINIGTDINFGELTSEILRQFKDNISYNTKVKNIKRQKDGTWLIKTKNLKTGENYETISKFVFIGAGGASLRLLQKSGIPEAKGYGGFPVSGQWLKCNNESVINRHFAKVYGKAEVGTPPMSMPHLDSRIINGKRELLFGPFAGFSTKFLKNGSVMDLICSVKLNNILTLLSAGKYNIPLTKYLIHQVSLSMNDRIKELRKFLPEANATDWELKMAGQRVQVIKEENGKGVIEFGTEVINSEDGTLSAILGASPGASTSVYIMLNVIKECFKNYINSSEWSNKLKEMIPSYGQSLINDEKLCKEIRSYTKSTLKI